MFFSSLTLSLFSLCYIGSNNEIIKETDPTMFNISYSETYDSYHFFVDIYDIDDTNRVYLLRYDDVTLFDYHFYSSANSYGTISYRYTNFNFLLNIHFGSSTHYHDVLDVCRMPTSSDGLVVVDDNQTNIGQLPNYAPSFDYVLTLLPEDTYEVFSTGSYNDGYDSGYQVGYDVGHNGGYEDGYQDGYDVGNSNGYTTGYNTGQGVGYNNGYNDALSNHDFSFSNLFGSIADTPILIIRRLFGFELFGVGLISVFMSLFTALIVIHLIKKVF